MQEVIPKTPANAVATVMIVLRTMPHTDFDFVLMLFGVGVTIVASVILTDFPLRRRRRRGCCHSGLLSSALYLYASFNWPSKLIWALLNSPVARARSFRPFTLSASVKSSAEAAPLLLNDAYGENGEVVQFYVLAVQDKLFGAGNHVGKHPFD